jgi:hypothetical protein
MYRRDEFIKKLSSLNSGKYLREQMRELEQYVDAELKKADTVLSLINSNPQGTISNNTEIVTDITETYAVHTENNISGDTVVVDGKVVWSDNLTFNNGKGSASASPWTHINISAESYDGNIKIQLPDNTNKNVAKMLANKYMDTAIQGDYPVGGHWGKDNVIVTYDLATNKLHMIFKLTHVPVESSNPLFYTAVGEATAECNSNETGDSVTVSLIRWSNKTLEDAQEKANKAALAEAYSKLVCIPNETHHHTIKVDSGWFSTCEGLLGYGYVSSITPKTENSDKILISSFATSDIVGSGSTPTAALIDAENKVKMLAIEYIKIGSSTHVCKERDHVWEAVVDINGCFDPSKGTTNQGQLVCKQHTTWHYKDAVYSDTSNDWKTKPTGYYESTSNGVFCPLPVVASPKPVVTMATPTKTDTTSNGQPATSVTWQFDFDIEFTKETLILGTISSQYTQPSDVSFYSGTGVKRIIFTSIHDKDADSYDVTFTLKNSDDYTLGSPSNKNTTISAYEKVIVTDPSCLMEGTLITMLDGSLRPIETIAVGDKLMSFNIHQLDIDNESVEYLANWSTPLLTFDTASTTAVGVKKASVNMIYSFNDSLYSTDSHDHMIYDGENYRIMFTRDIKEGYYLINKTGELEEITSIKIIESYVNVYYLNTEDYDIYIANDYITHNNARLKESQPSQSN